MDRQEVICNVIGLYLTCLAPHFSSCKNVFCIKYLLLLHIYINSTGCPSYLDVFKRRFNRRGVSSIDYTYRVRHPAIPGCLVSPCALYGGPGALV